MMTRKRLPSMDVVRGVVICVFCETLIVSAENETEISFFNRELYEEFKKNPEVGAPGFCFFWPC